MSTGGEPGHEHPVRTRGDTHYRYFFYDKHHASSGRWAAQWARDLSEDEEFSIFDRADTLDLLDSQGNLYGLRGMPQELLALGTLDEYIAKFPRAHADQPWHGFPVAPLRPVPPTRPPYRPVPVDALKAMQAQGLISEGELNRLKTRRHL
jgi:hypothetical protein